MSFLKRLIGGKRMQARPAEDSPESTIKVYDEFGRELYITRDEWRTNVLSGALAAAKNDPGKLYNTIVHALQDGFAADVLDSARHLAATDPEPARGACLLGVVLLQLKRFDEAEAVLQSFLKRHGEDGIILTNLAKVYAARGDQGRAESTLWRALELDPNQENGLGWYAAEAQEGGGDAASEADYRRVAALPGSWRAQLWLARGALKRGAVDEALSLYQQSLSRASVPDGQLLMQMSGDLGNAGRLAELVALVAPRFVPEAHGLPVGNNLLKAYIELGEFDRARAILNALFALKRPDYRDTLQFWEKELDDRTQGFGPVPGDARPAVRLLPYAGVVWARQKEGLSALLARKPEDAPTVAFMAASCALASPSQVPTAQRTSAEGALSRALALVLAEQVHLETSAQGVALVPVTRGGFVLAGQPWDDTQIVSIARGQGATTPLVANLHLDASQATWTVSMSLLRVSDGTPLVRTKVSIDPRAPREALDGLHKAIAGHVLSLPGVEPKRRPAWATLPEGPDLGHWLAACEQVLAVQFAALEQEFQVGLYAPRSIVDGLLSACLNAPGSALWRMLLVSAVARLQEFEPGVVTEYAERLTGLQRQYPITGEAGNAIAEVVGRIVSGAGGPGAGLG